MASSSSATALGRAAGLFGFADPALEARYRRDRVPYRTLNTRYSAFIVAIIWASFAFIDRYLVPDDIVVFGERNLQVRSTPGHTGGCLTYVLDDRSMAFTGDCLE